MPTVSVRLSPRELVEVRRRARSAGRNLSAYVRASILPQNPPPKTRPRLVRDRLTGALVLKSPPGALPLTLERVQEILADFP